MGASDDRVDGGDAGVEVEVVGASAECRGIVVTNVWVRRGWRHPEQRHGNSAALREADMMMSSSNGDCQDEKREIQSSCREAHPIWMSRSIEICLPYKAASEILA